MTDSQVEGFLSARSFAVVGASDDPRKFGHKVYAAYLQRGMRAYPVNPNSDTVLGNAAYPDLRSLPERPEAVSIITPPSVTERVMDEVIAAGAKHVWLQPGAESAPAIERAKAAGLNVLAWGPCVLVELARR
jgi:uncharacterized protein